AARVRGDLRGPHAQVRAQLAAQRRRRRDPRPARRRALPATHQALDAHPRRRAADQLRQALVTGKVLPPRDEELARTGQWLTGILTAAKPATARRLVQAYATWHVMRRPRASAARADGHAPTPPTPATTSAPPRTSLPGWPGAAGHYSSAARPTSTTGWSPAPAPARSATSSPGPPPAGTARRFTSPARPAAAAPPPARTNAGRWPPACCTTTPSTSPTAPPGSCSCSCSTASSCRGSQPSPQLHSPAATAPTSSTTT